MSSVETELAAEKAVGKVDEKVVEKLIDNNSFKSWFISIIGYVPLENEPTPKKKGKKEEKEERQIF